MKGALILWGKVAAPTVLHEDGPHLGGMVRNLELATDDPRQSGLGPIVTPKAIGSGPLGQQTG